MDIKEIKKKFDDANKNTLQILEKVIVFKSHMVDEINFVAKQAIESAKMEILLGQLANVPDYKLSSLAQQLKYNPSLDQMNGYQIVEGNANFNASNQADETQVKDGGETTIVENTEVVDDGAGVQPVEPREKSKPHSQVRRVWLAMQKIELDECELRIEVARLKQNGGKKSKDGKDKIVEFEL